MSRAAERIGSTALSAFFGILFVLNTFGGIVAGVWLAICGEWGSIGVGVLLSLLMPTAWAIAGLPAMLFLPLLVTSEEKGSRLGASLAGAVVGLYNAALVLAWTLFVFLLFNARATSGTVVPMLIWGYATATAPLSYMASKEPPDSYGSIMGVLMAEVAYIILVALMFLGVSLTTAIIVLVALGVAETVLMLALGLSMMPPRHRREHDPELI